MQTEEKPLDLQVLPEGCISNVLSLTSPRDACRLSLISTIFKRAGESDAVWERFLPSDYQAIISRSTSSVVPPDLSKKDLYFFLCDHPILIDGGTKIIELQLKLAKEFKSLTIRLTFLGVAAMKDQTIAVGAPRPHLSARFDSTWSACELGRATKALMGGGNDVSEWRQWQDGTEAGNAIPISIPTSVDKCTGKKIYMLGARDLSITWGSTPEHWRWRALPESRFAEVAELLAVCWLEIIGKIETRMLSPKTIYKAYLVIKFGDGMYGLQRSPANVSVSVGGNASGSKRLVYMCTEDDAHITNLRTRSLELEGKFPKNREDGWMEIEMGELFNHEGEDGEVKMTLTETKGGHWKGGLIVLGIELRPN
ncbi:hypothetical protein Scep_010102 [Stephania cephalantha]|uniref:F-box domain-containing protein n=1 Tax=Stephania cephalantha TaxID=152367 RepID=A0AAP0JUD9_9MAGN